MKKTIDSMVGYIVSSSPYIEPVMDRSYLPRSQGFVGYN